VFIILSVIETGSCSVRTRPHRARPHRTRPHLRLTLDRRRQIIM